MSAHPATRPTMPGAHTLTPDQEIVQRLAMDYWQAWLNDPECRPIKWHINEAIRRRTGAAMDLLAELAGQMTPDQRQRYTALRREAPL